MRQVAVQGLLFTDNSKQSLHFSFVTYCHIIITESLEEIVCQAQRRDGYLIPLHCTQELEENATIKRES